MNKPSPAPRMASVADAATILGLSRPTVYRLIGSGQLDTVKIGRRRLVRMVSLDAITSGQDKAA